MEIAILIPCYNEASAIEKVVSDCKQVLPAARIYVYDNNSTDETIMKAKKAGAVVRNESLQGKGNVVRRMFADIDADVYMMIDGDATYDVTSSPIFIEKLLSDNLDMINISRDSQSKNAYRWGHHWGNKFLTGMVNFIFGERFKDILSGYRIFSRRFVKSFPVSSEGFEIETELTVHALSLKMPVGEISAPYYSRIEGSISKLSTYKDGFKILTMIINLMRKEKPLVFYNIFTLIFVLLSLILGIPVVVHYFQTGFVPRLPTAVLSAALMIMAFLSLTCGLILDTVTKGRQELKRLFYLQYTSFNQEK